jgi:uncharacterized protein (DUF302 family)
MKNNEIGIEIELKSQYEISLKRVVEALKVQGFGVLTQIDVQATLKDRLGEEFRPYSILGACNPRLAHRALTVSPSIGLMLPCNVTVEESYPGNTIVRLANPRTMLNLGGQDDPELSKIADEAYQRIKLVADALSAK